MFSHTAVVVIIITVNTVLTCWDPGCHCYCQWWRKDWEYRRTQFHSTRHSEDLWIPHTDWRERGEGGREGGRKGGREGKREREREGGGGNSEGGSKIQTVI